MPLRVEVRGTNKDMSHVINTHMTQKGLSAGDAIVRARAQRCRTGC